MQVGSIVYATQSGLGVLARSFFDHGIVQRVLLCPHPHYENHPNWYPREARYSTDSVRAFLEGLDVLLLFERSHYPEVVREAARRGVRVVLMPMYEWTSARHAYPVDLFVCPSLLDVLHYADRPNTFLPVPVDVPWRLRERARVFVHNAGHGGAGYRNGTPAVLEAMRYVKSPIRLIVRAQPSGMGDRDAMASLFRKHGGDPRVELIFDNVPEENLWDEGDVFLFPEQYNGLSLPLQEAMASGLLVMATNRFPMNTWLPRDPLLPVGNVEWERMAVAVEKSVVHPRAIASAIDDWFDRDITRYSLAGREWAANHGWVEMAPRYRRVLEGVL